jgi:hypothetical protein
MAQLIFPSSPVNDQEFLGDNGITYIYKTTPGVWTAPSSGGGGGTAANPSPSNFSSSPAFESGDGSLANPFVITASQCYPGGQASSRQVITVANQIPGNYLFFSDENKATNGIRFNQNSQVINVDGKASFTLSFKDYPSTTAGGSYTGLVKCGTTYFQWVVTVVTTSYNDLSVIGPGGQVYYVNPTNVPGTGSFSKVIAADTSTDRMGWSGGAGMYNNALMPPGYSYSVNASGVLQKYQTSGFGTLQNFWNQADQGLPSTGVRKALIANNAYSYNLEAYGGNLFMIQKNDLSASVYSIPYADTLSFTNWSLVNNGPTATIKKFSLIISGSGQPSNNGFIVIGSDNNVYALAMVAEGNSSFTIVRPGLGSVGQTTGGSFGLYMSSPLYGTETIVDAQTYGGNILVLTDAGKVYTTQGATNNQSPVLVCEDAVGISTNTFYTFGISGGATSYGVLKKDGSIWGCVVSGAGPFASSAVPFRKLVSDQSFITPPLMGGTGWYAINSAGYFYGADGNSEAVRFGTQPSTLFNTRQLVSPIIFPS